MSIELPTTGCCVIPPDSPCAFTDIFLDEGVSALCIQPEESGTEGEVENKQTPYLTVVDLGESASEQFRDYRNGQRTYRFRYYDCTEKLVKLGQLSLSRTFHDLDPVSQEGRACVHKIFRGPVTRRCVGLWRAELTVRVSVFEGVP